MKPRWADLGLNKNTGRMVAGLEPAAKGMHIAEVERIGRVTDWKSEVNILVGGKALRFLVAPSKIAGIKPGQRVAVKISHVQLEHAELLLEPDNG